MIYLIRWLIKNKQPKTGLIVCVSLILAGAIGNMIDCMFYGVMFSNTGYAANTVAEFMPAGGGYAPFLQGRVVDMLYFPMIDTVLPEWVPFWGGKDFVFFSPIFNIADSAVTVGVALMLIFQKRFGIKDLTKEDKIENN
jgi:signal peptidase II